MAYTSLGRFLVVHVSFASSTVPTDAEIAAPPDELERIADKEERSPSGWARWFLKLVSVAVLVLLLIVGPCVWAASWYACEAIKPTVEQAQAALRKTTGEPKRVAARNAVKVNRRIWAWREWNRGWLGLVICDGWEEVPYVDFHQ